MNADRKRIGDVRNVRGHGQREEVRDALFYLRLSACIRGSAELSGLALLSQPAQLAQTPGLISIQFNHLQIVIRRDNTRRP